MLRQRAGRGSWSGLRDHEVKKNLEGADNPGGGAEMPQIICHP